MYEQFYGFREKPFALTPDPAFLYFGRHHKRALLQLEYGLTNDAAFVLITGEVGAGKTTLIRHLLGRLTQNVTVGLISNTVLGNRKVLKWVCAAFGLKPRDNDEVTLYDAFIDFVIEEYASGRRVVLIVDEAQNLGRVRLEELRVVSNMNVDKHLVLQTILVGQPELRDMMKMPQLRQFAQRIGADYHIGRLTAEETAEYIRHRIKVAGCEREDLFDEGAIQLTHAASRGTPRLINQICDTALVYRYADERLQVDDALMREVISDRVQGGIFPIPGVPSDADTEGAIPVRALRSPP